MTDFRAELQLLFDDAESFAEASLGHHYLWVAALNRAHAALAEQPVEPTPIPVVERWPEFSDCDPQERVWVWNPVLGHWKLLRINRSVHTHWLPANALPAPEAS